MNVEKDFWICPSILSADFARLGEEVTNVLKSGADRIHIDVMDNHYVPNLTFGPLVCKALRNYGISAPLDVHLMVEPVDELIHGFIASGADCICFHPEATLHVDRSLQIIKDANVDAGLVLNPATNLDCLEYVLDKIDRVLLMSVNPGFAGQKFIPSVLEKAKQLRKLISEKNLSIRIEIDGGVNVNNIANIAAAGVDTFVAGSAIFGSDNYKTTIDKMRANLPKMSS
ncbi:MAG: ribulose-phosphate 3-epimerase [Thiotrichales bacterium]|nr:MAG: ribulose-phosphate 3-epimerase [Thiotrichales bacterium]